MSILEKYLQLQYASDSQSRYEMIRGRGILVTSVPTPAMQISFRVTLFGILLVLTLAGNNLFEPHKRINFQKNISHSLKPQTNCQK